MSRSIFIAAALALAVTLPAMPAQAAASRTFVSAAGNDSNPCTITLPCRNFAAAYMATNPNGQIDALDPGNYGSLTITGPVNIQGHGWASMSAPSGAAITINSPGATDKIFISGVVLDGLGIVGTNGIQFNSGGSLTVHDSVIQNFDGNGIVFEPTSSGASQIFVSNTLVSDNVVGISIIPGGSGKTTGVLDRVQMNNNGGIGLLAGGSGQAINITVSDSVIANNESSGIDAQTNSGTPVSITVRNSTIANNGAYGLEADDAGATILVTRSTITGNLAAGWAVAPTGLVLSYGDNNIDGNNGTTPNPAPPCVNGSSPCGAYK